MSIYEKVFHEAVEDRTLLQKENEALKAEVERLRKLAYNLSTGNLKSMPGNDSYNRGYLDGAKMAGDNITKALNHKEG